jgi:hypothetical protein
MVALESTEQTLPVNKSVAGEPLPVNVSHFAGPCNTPELSATSACFPRSRNAMWHNNIQNGQKHALTRRFDENLCLSASLGGSMTSYLGPAWFPAATPPAPLTCGNSRTANLAL